MYGQAVPMDLVFFGNKTKMTENPGKTYVPVGSLYGIFTYIWLIFMVNEGKYTIHGSYGVDK